MPKSVEQKAAEALTAGVKNTDWNPAVFAKHVIHLEASTQWRILEAFYFIIRAWRREREQEPYFDRFLTAADTNPDISQGEKEFTDGDSN